MSNRKQIAQFLIQLGVPPHLKGYRYIISALELFSQGDWHHCITTKIYPAVAKEHGETPSRVERCIRHAIGCASIANTTVYHVVIGQYLPRGRKPMNGHFLAAVDEAIRLGLVDEKAS